MLRTKLGDEVFFASLAEYIDLHKNATVETPDLRKVLEARSGESLEQFFYQWTTRPGIPRLNIATSWDDSTSTLTATVEQTQPIDGDNPAFEFILPLFIATDAAGGSVIESIEVRGRSATKTFTLAQRPRFVAIDHARSVLAQFNITQDESEALAQLADAPTLFARVKAARTLGTMTGMTGASSAFATESLRRLVSQTDQPTTLRVEAVRALAARGNSADVRALSSTSIDRWEVRLAITEALAAIAQREENKSNPQALTSIGERLALLAANDDSVRVRAAAIRSIGTLGLIEQSRAVARALTQESQHDQVRQAAIVATADLAGPRAAALIIPFTRQGTISRTRPIAIGALSRVASQDPKAAFEAFAAQARDRDLRTRRAAWRALADLGDASVLALFDALINESRSPELKAELQSLRATLAAK
jgi:aminopeptidase N